MALLMMLIAIDAKQRFEKHPDEMKIHINNLVCSNLDSTRNRFTKNLKNIPQNTNQKIMLVSGMNCAMK